MKPLIRAAAFVVAVLSTSAVNGHIETLCAQFPADH
jgi:hypothetical protein